MKRNTLIYLGLAGLTAALFSVGCNSNPVAAPQTADTLLGYSLDGRIDESNSVDILWVIDNSGSMGDEQVALIDNFKQFILGLNFNSITYQMAVTTTEPTTNAATGYGSQKKPGEIKGYKPGEFRRKANPLPGPTSLNNFAVKDGKILTYNDVGEAIAQNYAQIAYAAWNCVDLATDQQRTESLKPVSDINLKKLLLSYLEADRTDLEVFEKNYGLDGDDTKDNKRDELLAKLKDMIKERLKDMTYLGNASGSNTNKQPDLAGIFPNNSSYQEFDPIVKSTEKLGEVVRHFGCLALVGTEGWGIEKGLQTMLAATNSQNNKEAKKLVRQRSKFSTIFVSDENDCFHEPLADGRDFNDLDCLNHTCNFFAASGLPNNPMVSVETVQSRFVNNLSALKGGLPISNENIVVAALTGTSRPLKWGEGMLKPGGQLLAEDTVPDNVVNTLLNGNTPVQFCIDNIPFYKVENRSKENVCSNTNYEATTGDRYNDFAELFPSHYPYSSQDEGLLCEGSFGQALSEIAKLLNQTAAGCVTSKLAHQSECQNPGDTCGPNNVPCKPIVGSDPANLRFYCPIDIEVIAASIEPNDQPIDQIRADFCIENQTPQNYAYSCYIKPEKYDIKACPGADKGFKFELKNKDVDLPKLSDVNLWVNYAAFYTPAPTP